VARRGPASAGASSPPRHDWQRLISNKDAEIARLNGVYARLLQDRGVKVWMGRARIAGAHRVEVVDAQGGSTVVTAHKVLVATGGEPVRPNVPGSERVWVSDDIFHLPEMPARVLVVGGGYIAVELAGVFAGYGASVTQIYRGALFLRGFDRDVRAHLDEQMRKKGIDLRFPPGPRARGQRPVGRARGDPSTTARPLEVDGVLAAIGRVPRSSGMGLEEAGVELDARGAVRVDASFQTSVPWIYAAGDVIDRVQLTPVALAEGTLIAQHLFGGASRVPDYDLIPSAVFSNPPIATVGMTEEEARAELGAIDVYKSTFTAMKATLGGRGDRVLMKLVVERSTDRVVGVHMVGADAAEILQGFAVALRCGATKAQFDATIGIHPSAAEELVTPARALPGARSRCLGHAPRGAHEACGSPPLGARLRLVKASLRPPGRSSDLLGAHGGARQLTTGSFTRTSVSPPRLKRKSQRAPP
jgi:glutathione reductase (NADPH)